jgi:hypothetical protein
MPFQFGLVMAGARFSSRGAGRFRSNTHSLMCRPAEFPFYVKQAYSYEGITPWKNIWSKIAKKCSIKFQQSLCTSGL